MDPVNTFRDEAQEHLNALEQALLDLELDPNNVPQIAAAFRAMHTIKGSAGMVGFAHLSYFTHHLENLFESVRNKKVTLTPELCQCVLLAADHMNNLLNDIEPNAELVQVSETILAKLADVLPTDSLSVATLLPKKQVKSTRAQHYRIDIKPHQQSFCEGFDLLPILRELRDLGDCHISCFFTEPFEPESFDPELCYLQLQVLLSTINDIETINDVFIFVKDDWLIQIDQVEQEQTEKPSSLLVAKGMNELVAVDETPKNQSESSGLLSEPTLIDPERQLTRNQTNTSEEQSIRVPQHKLDALMDQVGELVILQASLDQLALSCGNERLVELAEELDRLSNDLRDIAFDIRMLPIGSTFARFRRLIRDLCRDLGKDVVLETHGANTELDKVVLDKLVDPLVHMLRNSLDHGIENPEQRRLAGKPERGVISLSASHYQGQILIEIADDGKGLDADKILTKAIERGLIAENSVLEKEDIYALIFAAGFSTADRVSDVSGRGVGMDVVRSAIDALQGQIHIRSELGQGTSFRILLPMTLSIIDGLMVAVSKQCFIVPLNMVEECIETIETEVDPQSDTCLIEYRGHLIPRLRLREKFSLFGKRPAIEQTVIVRVNDQVIGITVDEVVGNHQTVIRNLGKLYKDVPGVMGATILGDGGIAMILDLMSLFISANKYDTNI